MAGELRRAAVWSERGLCKEEEAPVFSIDDHHHCLLLEVHARMQMFYFSDPMLTQEVEEFASCNVDPLLVHPVEESNPQEE